MSEYIYGTDGHEGHWLTGEEIVRCRDCINKTTVGDRCLFFAMQLRETGTAVYPRITGDGFCKWGRKVVDA